MNRIAWYQAAGRRNRKRYALTEVAAVPVATTARLDGTVVAALGAIMLVATGIRTTFQVHENWIEDNRMRYDIERDAALLWWALRRIRGLTRHGISSSGSSFSPTAADIAGWLAARVIVSRRKPAPLSFPRSGSRASLRAG